MDEGQNLIFVFLIFWAACAGIGYVIDRDKGTLWGLGLGPLGLLIAAILKDKQSPVASIKPETKTGDAHQKWLVLKDVDADIMSAANRIDQFASENGVFSDELHASVAEKYFQINDKQYLESIVDKVLSEPLPVRHEAITIEAAGGREITLTLNDEGEYVARTLGGDLKHFRSVDQAIEYFN